MINFLKTGDYRSYASIKGIGPTSPVEASYLQAMSAAELCGYDARMAQLTGKTPPARDDMAATDGALNKNARTDAAGRQVVFR